MNTVSDDGVTLQVKCLLLALALASDISMETDFILRAFLVRDWIRKESRVVDEDSGF